MIERPLDADAVHQADEQIYTNHANDPRPNALYDAQGNRLKLDATDPSQEDLRQEWRDLYKAALAKKKQGQGNPPPAPRPGGNQPPKKPTADCPLKHWIKISLLNLKYLQTQPDWVGARACATLSERAIPRRNHGRRKAWFAGWQWNSAL